MADLLEQSSAWLEEKRHNYLTKTVTYMRGELSVELQATIGRTEFEIDKGYGLLEKVVSRDFLILACELVLDDEATLPERGDKIREIQSGFTFEHEVMAPGGEPHYRYSDPYRKTLRIHTKETAREATL